MSLKISGLILRIGILVGFCAWLISRSSWDLSWKLWEVYIWQGYYAFLFHYKYMYPPNDGRNVSAEFRALSTSTMVHRLLFPPPIDANEWLDYFEWVTADAVRVYAPIDWRCSILPSSHTSSDHKPSLWIIGHQLLSDLNKYNHSEAHTLFMVHGGAFVAGSGSMYHGIACHLSNYFKMRVLLIDYELTPKYTLPTPIDTIFAAYLFLLNEMSINAENIIFEGDSAGGILSIWTLQRILRDNIAQPKGVILMSPWLDITCSTDAWRYKFTNFDAIPSRNNVYRNALWMVSNRTDVMDEYRIENTDLNGLNTAFLVVVGKNEVLYEEVMNFKDVCLNQLNVQWNEIIIEYGMHDQAFLIDLLPEARQTLSQIARFVHGDWYIAHASK
eukprot:73486_1